MAIHFTAEEFQARRAATCSEMVRRGLRGLLLFRQESLYYLTGYDTFGYCFFQCLYLDATSGMTLLTRAPDLRQARHTSVIQDIRVWVDEAGKNPALDLRALLAEHGCQGAVLGVELDTHGLTAFNWRRLETALHGFCALQDASDLVSQLRLVKSPTELSYIRRAAELADAALDEAMRLAEPGAFEGDILAAMQGAVFRGGGDYPGNAFIIGSGADALLCRYFSGRRRLAANDQLTLEFAGVYHHYHACLMRTIVIGAPTTEHRAMHRACVDALHACQAALKPGQAIGAVFDAHAQVMDAAGYREARLNACGYSLGAVYPPSWMDWPMLYHGNPVIAQPNMVFFLHMIVMDSSKGLAMTLGHTVLVTAAGCEALSRRTLGLLGKSLTDCSDS
ncbi:MAG: Xaa-Pro peptidase family protein [Gammaproteobacteria bacterium]